MTAQSPHIEMLIQARERDLGGFTVKRVLPHGRRRMVGPFIFLDQMGPVRFPSGKGIDVRPHPHIGLATVTYLLRGEFEHRDSLGTVQMIYPGELNWMIAGRGITHSERTSAETRRGDHELYGLQIWVALPKSHEEMAPQFQHFQAEALPTLEKDGAWMRLVMGRAFGMSSPAATFSPMFYLHVRLAPGASLTIPDEHRERAAYFLEGTVFIDEGSHSPGVMTVFRPGGEVALRAGEKGAEFVLLGGETMDGPREIWWNFVASSQEKIEAAKVAWQEEDWAHGRFRLPAGDDREWIPLPT